MMAPEILFIFVEGNDDERFFKSIVTPLFDCEVKYIQYAQLKKKIVQKFVTGIEDAGYDYIFAADIDEHPKVTSKKRYIENKFECLDEDKIVIVVKEIESWYLAGLENYLADEYRITIPTTTDEVTKEIFNNIYHGRFHSRLEFMLELLKVFSLNIAEKRNKSFKYFLEKYYIDVVNYTTAK